MCDCKHCEMSRRIADVYDSLPETVQDIIDDLWLEWEHDSMEHGYYKAVVEGVWPNADEIIENARRSKIVLTSEEAELVFHTLENPPKTSQKLLDAAKRYKEKNMSTCSKIEEFYSSEEYAYDVYMSLENNYTKVNKIKVDMLYQTQETIGFVAEYLRDKGYTILSQKGDGLIVLRRTEN